MISPHESMSSMMAELFTRPGQDGAGWTPIRLQTCSLGSRACLIAWTRVLRPKSSDRQFECIVVTTWAMGSHINRTCWQELLTRVRQLPYEGDDRMSLSQTLNNLVVFVANPI